MRYLLELGIARLLANPDSRSNFARFANHYTNTFVEETLWSYQSS